MRSGGISMRRDYKSAIRALVNALYTGDHEEGCREALELLDSDLAALFDEDEEAAHLKVNDEEELDIDSEEDDYEAVVIEEY
jgi:hypothetical protein